MPHKPLHGCRHQGCRALVKSGESYCEAHIKAHVNDFTRAHPEWFKLYNNKRWRAYRRMFLAAHPLCINFEECHNEATVVDHIEPHKGDWDKFWDQSNHRAMCKRCHDKATAMYDGGFGNARKEKP